ncbi:MAG: T9SS type A sorting domain-containing protein [Candidatus Cloacimonetes bacterium]|nr:T9SS type A sorting domain-containing protein [Candidatus Cloacimonadota bacterium]
MCKYYFTLVIILILLQTCLMATDSRPYGKRIQSSHSHSEVNQFPWYSDTYGTYYYSSDNTAFFDSITYVYSTSDFWLWGLCHDYTYKYRHNVYYQDGNEYAEHHEYRGNPPQLLKINIVVRNSAKQIIEHNKVSYNDNGTINNRWSWEPYYNSYGKPDSVYYESLGYGNINRVNYLFQYDNLQRINQVLMYIYENDGWSMKKRTVHHYNDDAIQYPATMRFIDYSYSSISGCLIGLLYVCDMDYPPQTIGVERWNGSAWVPDQQTYYVNVNNSTGLVSISIQDDYYYGSVSTYRFSLATGLYRGSYSHGGGGEVWGSSSITWEDYVANQDEYLPETASAILLTAYPNPFKNNLIIHTQDKSLENISIYNIKGQLIRSWKDIRTDELTWDGKDESNHSVSSGIYLIKARQGNQMSTAKVLKFQ